jgi:hypothetical protein
LKLKLQNKTSHVAYAFKSRMRVILSWLSFYIFTSVEFL